MLHLHIYLHIFSRTDRCKVLSSAYQTVAKSIGAGCSLMDSVSRKKLCQNLFAVTLSNVHHWIQ